MKQNRKRKTVWLLPIAVFVIVCGMLSIWAGNLFRQSKKDDFTFQTMFADGEPMTYEGADSGWVTVEDGHFMLGDDPFVSIGFTNYTHANSSFTFIEEMMLDAKRAGFNMVRVLDMTNGVGTGKDSWKSEAHWRQTDFIVATAQRLGMKVLLDLSNFRNYLYESTPKVDCYDLEIFPLWDEIVDYVTKRVNTYTGKAYGEDPVICSYAILGEPVPYGGEIGDWSGGVNSSRDPKDVTRTILHIAKRLKQNAPQALIQTGGLLHIEQSDALAIDVTEQDCEEWKLTLEPGRYLYSDVLFNSGYIDFASIHLYPIVYKKDMDLSEYFDANGKFKEEKGGLWNELEHFTELAVSYGKPLMVEEFGVDRNYVSNDQARAYLQYCFDRMDACGVRNAVVWNLGYGRAFDVGPQVPELWTLFEQYTRQWGTTQLQGEPFGPLYPLMEEKVSETSLLASFEGEPSGQQVIGNPYPDATRASEGAKAMKVTANFKSTYSQRTYTLPVEQQTAIGDYDYLALDVYLPSGFDSMFVRLAFQADGVLYTQTEADSQTNYLLPGRWKTVYMPLKNRVSNEISPAFEPQESPASDSRVESVQITVKSGTVSGSPDFWFDHVRLIKAS